MIRHISAGRTAAALTAIGLVLGLAMGPASAGDVKMYDTAPSVEELEKTLSKPKVKTRAIVFGDQPAEPAAEVAPAAAPAGAFEVQQPSQPSSQQPATKKASYQQPARTQQAAPAIEEASSAAVGFPINFDLGSATVRHDSLPFLDSIAGLMRKDSSISLIIEGHTDASGSYQSNVELSRARAFSVMNMLVTRYGIDPSRLRAEGKGPTQPLTGNPYDAQNRRVQFRVAG